MRSALSMRLTIAANFGHRSSHNVVYETPVPGDHEQSKNAMDQNAQVAG
ncbi:hypothetical protein LRP30_30645 [Bradyrhizobium sp. C-145]|nr:hypothetical protein [Bradyrhizobium sp. C-145]UQR61284.1 hypothetical protein LRP30_30645 [Bradyrhizobium sp. C-145]